MSRIQFAFGLCVTLLALGVSSASAHYPSNLVAEYGDQYRALTEADRIAIKERVEIALGEVDVAFSTLLPSQITTWDKALQLSELRGLLGSDSQNTRALRSIERRFYGLSHGLDTEVLVNLRYVLNHYICFLNAYQVSDLRAEFERRLAALDEALTEDIPDAFAISRDLQWLISAQQVPELVADIQEQFQTPSIVVDVNPQLIIPFLAEARQEIKQSEFTTNTILGVPVSGMNHFNALIRPDMQENDHRATVRLILDGTIDSPENDSHPDPQKAPLIGDVSVALKTAGKTKVTGYKDIYWNGFFLEAEPAVVQCETDASLNNVDIYRKYYFPASNMARNLDSKIREKAHKEVAKNSHRAARQSASLAQRQVQEQLDAEVQTLLNQANADIYKFYRAPLLGIGVYPNGVSRSDQRSVHIGFRGVHGAGIGAENFPFKEKLTGDLELSMHETMCSSMWNGYLSGREIEDNDFRNIHREMRGFVPMELRLSGKEKWSVTLCDETPLEARFRNGCADVIFHIEQVTINNIVHDYPISVSACYQVIPEICMPKFYRMGEIEIEFREGQPVNAGAGSNVHDLVKRKFNAFFATDIHMDGMSAPVGNEWGTAAQLQVIQSDMENGWWRLVFKQNQFNRLN